MIDSLPVWVFDTLEWIILSISIGARFLLTGLIVYGLREYRDGLEWGERLGMGMIGGSAFLTIPVVLDLGKNGTPFDVWAGTVLVLGCLIFIRSRQIRLARHSKANAAMVDQAIAHGRRKKRASQP